MGLDIYFHRFKSGSSDIEKIVAENDAAAKRTLSNFFSREFNRLSLYTFGTDKFNEEWSKFYSELQKYSHYSWRFEKLSNPMPLDKAKVITQNYVDDAYAECNAYFRKVNFIYGFFQDKLTDEWCFVTKEDCIELIDRCQKIKAKPSLAPELLPTTQGVFFGSYEYDKYYFEDIDNCIEQITNLLNEWQDGERCYVYMSW